MSGDGFKLQVSYKFGGDAMLNVRADSVDELGQALARVESELLTVAVTVGELLRGAAAAAPLAVPPVAPRPPAPVAAPAYAPPAPVPQYPAPAAPPAGPAAAYTPVSGKTGVYQEDKTICAHGARKYHSTAKWQAWFCPLPKGTPGICDAVFANA